MGRMIEPNRRKRWLPLVVAASVLAVGMTTSTQVVAQDAAAATAAPAEPQPDPSGIATGDKNNAVDAGGTAFVVAEPTDKTAPDYAEKKKAFDEFKAHGERAAGGETGRFGRPRPNCDQLFLDADHRLPRALHAGRISRC